MFFGISRTVPLAYRFPSVQGEKNMQTQQCRALCQSPPPVLGKSFCVFHREIPGAHPTPSQSPNIQRQSGRQGDGERRQPAAAATAMLQPRYYKQDIPKQLEGGDIWCCALVLGPPQNGPALSGNLVIFGASLARLHLSRVQQRAPSCSERGFIND